MNRLSDDFELDMYGLHVRLVTEDDAGFILKLRTNEKLSRYIHSTDNDIEKQREWLRLYKKRQLSGKEYYFIFYSNGCPVGLNRIYNIHDTTYTSGSWIFEPDAPLEASVASALIVRIIAFDILKMELEDAFDGCHEDNVKVLKFNKMIGLELTGSIKDVKGTYYTGIITKESFYKHRPKLEKLLNLKP